MDPRDGQVGVFCACGRTAFGFVVGRLPGRNHWHGPIQPPSRGRRLEVALGARDALRLVVEHLADEVTYGPDALQAAAMAAAQRDDVVAGLEVLA